MSKFWAAFVAVVLFVGSPALAATWADGFKACDSDSSSTVSRTEWNSCESKVGDPTMNLTFRTMDKDTNNSIDKDEWAVGEKQKMAIGNACKKAEGSWCPCQNNPDDPSCQKN